MIWLRRELNLGPMLRGENVIGILLGKNICDEQK